MKKYMEVDSMLNNFWCFMRDRKVAQWNPMSNDTVDRECGCCMGAHLARFFSEDGNAETYGVVNYLNDELMYDNAPMHMVVDSVPQWKDQCEMYMQNLAIDQHYENFPEDVEYVEPSDVYVNLHEMMSDEGLVGDWAMLASNEGDADMSALSYDDGVACLHKVIGVEDDLERRLLFDELLG